MLQVHIDIKGDKQAAAKLKALGGELDNWEPELQKVGEYLKNFYQRIVFSTEGAIYGQRWADIQPATEFYKRTHATSFGILEFSGKMRDSFEFRTGRDYMELQNPTPYAKFHQFGTSKMPARPMVKVDNDRKDAIIDIFKEGLADKINKAVK